MHLYLKNQSEKFRSVRINENEKLINRTENTISNKRRFVKQMSITQLQLYVWYKRCKILLVNLPVKFARNVFDR